MKLPLNLHDSGTRRYLWRCLRWRFYGALQKCPACGQEQGKVVDRKFGITSLVDCERCGLLYRRPQEPPTFAEDFYQEEYQSSLATIMPSDKEIAAMVDQGFSNSEKCFRDKIALLRELDVPEGARVLDYGASWGYGVWQLRQAGYDAMGFELSKPRARFGAEKLGVTIETELKSLEEESFDVVFSNHVLEHIPNVNESLQEIAVLVKGGGLLLAFVPNGSQPCQEANPGRFHSNWGRLHPIYLNDRFLARELERWPFRLASKRYDEKADASLLGDWTGREQSIGDLKENELMMAVRF